jgi:hypothetical protein
MDWIGLTTPGLAAKKELAKSNSTFFFFRHSEASGEKWQKS